MLKGHPAILSSGLPKIVKWAFCKVGERLKLSCGISFFRIWAASGLSGSFESVIKCKKLQQSGILVRFLVIKGVKNDTFSFFLSLGLVLLAHLGVVLGHLEPSWGHLYAIFGRSFAISGGPWGLENKTC